MNLLRPLALTLAWAMVSAGQTVVEHAVGTAAAAGASSGASGAGKAAGGVFGNLTKVLEKSAASTASTAKPAANPSTAPIQTSAPVAARGKAPASRPIDPSVVVAGLTRAELIERCGSPSLATQRTLAGSMIETFWYQTTTDDELEVQLTDGKVASSILASEKLRTRVAAAAK